SFASAAINRNPGKFEIRWRFAWTAWPGMAVLHDVETRGRSRRLEWDARLDSVSAYFHVLPFFHRTAYLTRVEARGVVHRHRRRRLVGALARVPTEELPPILQTLDGSAAQRPTGPAPSGNRSRPPWTIRADRIFCELDELWLDRFRLTGPMQVETGMSL